MNFNVEDDEWYYCCVPANSRCPIYDRMLASKLWLEADYEEFMRVANRHHKRTDRTELSAEGRRAATMIQHYPVGNI